MRFSATCFYSVLLFGFVITAGCSSGRKTIEISTLAPEPETTDSLILPAKNSYINLPVRIEMNGLADLLNQHFNGLIYHDSLIEEDNIRLKIWKEAPVSLSIQDKKIKSVLPLRAVVTYRIGTNKLGFPIYDERTLYLNGIVTLISSVKLSNWSFITQTHINQLVWKENPSIQILGQNVSVANLVNPAIGLFKKTIEQQIDQSLRESLNFKHRVLEAVNALRQPQLLSETYESRLVVDPKELYISDSQTDTSALYFGMGIKANIYTVLGQIPEIKSHLPLLRPVKEIPDRAEVALLISSTYKEAARLVLKNFQGQSFGEGKKQVRITGVALWQKAGKLIVKLNLEGSVKGNIYLSGYPQFNAVTQEVYFDQLNYLLDTKNALLKSANWLASNRMLIAFQQLCRYSLAEQFEELKTNLVTYTRHYPLSPGIYLDGQLDTFDFVKFELGAESLFAHLILKGKLIIELKGVDK